ncbi:hypothetical protein KOR42_12710 [Thalassoglobus neptunius]|uniref:Uncharacterized protein n=1 Tax=Thalassoglobus neptunius TaxID=1938619 RepID=A0A5C5X4J8_9PLAN|nr:hypothetical protein [Thalassoglobus neptunius]TWT57904.1 hypothetical protein KOR42_12710 [Thalassoglobus neptunius]
MPSVKKLLAFGVVLSLFWGIHSPDLFAQTPREQTILSIDILLPRNSTDIVRAQEWGRVFEKLGHSVRISRPVGKEEPSIKETTRGSLRVVRLKGAMDRDGLLYFPDVVFKVGESEQLKTWLDELIVYGAQGAPEGKKLWGLNQTQFEQVLKQLSQPVESSTLEKSFEAAIASLPFSKDVPLVVDPQAQKQFGSVQEQIVQQEYSGLTLGTALAGLLNDFGLGFMPLRTPDGTLQLSVRRKQELTNGWPIGWKVDDLTPRNQIAPALFEFVRTGFENRPLTEVLAAIASQTKVPVVVDLPACKEKSIDPSASLVSYPQKQTAWAVVLASVVRQGKLTHSIRQDEAGKPVVLVAPFVPYRLEEK